MQHLERWKSAESADAQTLRRCAADVIDATARYEAEFDREARRVVYLSRAAAQGCVLTLYTRDNGRSEQLWASQEQLKKPRFSRSGKLIYVLSDRGRDGRFALHSLAVDGGKPSGCILPSASAIVDYLPLDGDRLLLQEEDFESGMTSLVLLSAEGRRNLVALPGYLALREVHASCLFATQLIGANQHRPFTLDLATSQLTWLGDATTSKRVGYAPAGGRYELLEDATARSFRRLDASGSLVASYEPPHGEVEAWCVTTNAEVVAVLVRHGAEDEVRLLDACTLHERAAQPQLAPAAMNLRGMAADGGSLLVEVSGIAGPWETFVIDLNSGASRPLDGARAASRSAPAAVRCIDARVHAHDGLLIPVHGYLPTHMHRFPAIVWLHGGPADVSRKAWDPFWPFYVRQGFAVVVPNIRGSTGFGVAYQHADRGRLRLNAFRDLERVNLWIRSQVWWNGKTIIAMGGSYGGYLTYVALTKQPELWSAGIALVAPSNLKSLLACTTGAARRALELEFGDPQRDSEFLDAISPLHDAAQIRAPVYIYQGENDPVVPRQEAEQMVAALTQNGVAVEYQLARDEGHSIDRRDTRLDFLVRSTRFLREHVLLGRAVVHPRNKT